METATKEILVVTSKVKQFNKANKGLNTSAEVIDALTDHLQTVLTQAQASAIADGRKTVMKRDIETVLTLKPN